MPTDTAPATTPAITPATTPGKTASTSVPLHPLLAARWSPRGFDVAHSVPTAQLTALLEAARWAPSASNTQPWRFAVAERGTPAFPALLAALAEGNRGWAPSASALVVAAAQTVGEDGGVRPWARYDTGQAVAHLSVQAAHEGLSVHQLGGFDPDAVRRLLQLPDDVEPVVVLAVGRHDPAARLPEALAARERAARERLPLDALLLPLPEGLAGDTPQAA